MTYKNRTTGSPLWVIASRHAILLIAALFLAACAPDGRLINDQFSSTHGPGSSSSKSTIYASVDLSSCPSGSHSVFVFTEISKNLLEHGGGALKSLFRVDDVEKSLDLLQLLTDYPSEASSFIKEIAGLASTSKGYIIDLRGLIQYIKKTYPTATPYVKGITNDKILAITLKTEVSDPTYTPAQILTVDSPADAMQRSKSSDITAIDAACNTLKNKANEAAYSNPLSCLDNTPSDTHTYTFISTSKFCKN